MTELYKKLQLYPNCLDEFLSLTNKLENYVYQENPELNKSIVWIMTENYPTLGVFETHESVYEKLQWNIVADKVEGLNNFFDKFNLIKTFARGNKGFNWPHRHTYPKGTHWSITFLSDGSNNSVVNFYTVEDHNYTDQEYTVRQQDTPLKIFELPVNEGDVYSFNTWVWHDWVTKPSDSGNKYFFFALKAVNVDERDSALEFINKLYE